MQRQAQIIPVNPALLTWARNTAGLSLRDAARRAKITPPRRRKNEEPATPVDRLASWEKGQTTPTLPQLKALAKAYHRPLVTFFLAAPPAQTNPLTDYRTLPAASCESPEFGALKRRIFRLHRTLRAIAEDELTAALPFVGSCAMEDGIPAVIDVIRKTLAFDPTTRRRPHESVFAGLREKAQAAGLYVLLMGNLGSHHSNVGPEEFRGIALADPYAPLVVINSNDAKSAMPFTLAHELAHVFLGAGGISNQNAFEPRRPHKSVEQFCNAVAAELLAPENLVRPAWNERSGEPMDAVRRLAQNFGVSEEVIARRLSDLGLLDKDDYGRLIALYRARQHDKVKNDESGGGPDANVLARYNLGAKTVETLVRATDSGLITLRDAARALNISVDRFEKIAG